MLCSRTTIGAFLNGVASEMGLYRERDRAYYRDLMNEALAFLYAAVIRRRAEGTGTPRGGAIYLPAVEKPAGTGEITESDVLAVYCGRHQLRYLPPEELLTAEGLPCCFYTVAENEIRLSHAETVKPLRLIFTVRPPAYTAEDEETVNVPLPEEFLPMLAARIRGEAYRAAGDDAAAATWLGVYNAALADFYDYLAKRRRR